MRARWTFLICAVIILMGALIMPYTLVCSPHFANADYTGMVSQHDFEKAHSQGGIRQGSGLNPAPTMLIYPNDPYVQKIASLIEGGSDIQKALSIAEWTSENIRYETDSVLYGCREYWAVPAETLYYMKGDCEDYAILFCSIARALDMNVVLLEYPDHISPGLYADDGNLYHCNAIRGCLSTSLTRNDCEPSIYHIGEEQYGWFNDYLITVSRWERSIVDLPISLWDMMRVGDFSNIFD